MRRKLISVISVVAILAELTVILPFGVQARTFVTAPEPITSLTVESGDTWYYLSWEPSEGATHYSVRYCHVTYPSDNVSGTEGYFGTDTSCNVTGLSTSTIYYFSVFPIAIVGGVGGFNRTVTQSKAEKSSNGWGVFNEIYYDPTQEDANNTFLEDTADELAYYLGEMSGRSWSVNTTTRNASAIALSVNSTLLTDYNDDTFKILIDFDSIDIIGKTPWGAMMGANTLLMQYGVRWLAPTDTWTVIPDVLTALEAQETIYEPDFIFRWPWLNSTGSTSADITAYINHNRMYGANSYETHDNMYGHIYPWATYQAGDPSAFTGADGEAASHWSLNGYSSNVSDAAIAYANTYLDDTARSSLTGYHDTKTLRASFPCQPNDGGWAMWNPPWTTAQDITDSVMNLANAVAANVSAAGKFVTVGNYSGASGIPSYNGTFNSNLIVWVAPHANIRDTDWDVVVDALIARNDVKVGVYTVYMIGSFVTDPMDTIQQLADWNTTSENFTWWEGEASNFQWAFNSRMYVLSQCLWDTSVNTTQALQDYCDAAFGAASDTMYTYLSNIYSKNLDVLQDGFELLDTALDEASGDDDVLERIKEMICWQWAFWKYRIPDIGSYDNLSQPEEEQLYTLITKLRDTELIQYSTWESNVRSSLKTRFPETYPDDASVYSIGDATFTEPTMEEALIYLADGIEG